MTALFELGVERRVQGVYIAHWEGPRFVIARQRKVVGGKEVLCDLKARPGIPQAPVEAAGMTLPDDRRHHRGLRFDVAARVTPVEQGRFGHRERCDGGCVWRTG